MHDDQHFLPVIRDAEIALMLRARGRNTAFFVVFYVVLAFTIVHANIYLATVPVTEAAVAVTFFGSGA